MLSQLKFDDTYLICYHYNQYNYINHNSWGVKMLKKLNAVKARQNLGQLMNEVALKEDDYIIERAGKELVAIIPIAKYRRFEKEEQQARNNFFKMVDQMRKKVKDADAEVLDKAISEAVTAAKN